ncbi:methylase of polypeptide chain release factor [Levilactobacillus senmaizukei DSM 21775 = NBRC 103853]|uniref:Release factor glutamine methyltransferase n=1 Tax=Levilactobacillus senmaizukei DSM 21775 = NBRC 103853 TaxID=1423803 RepID=A0A0R2DCJ3_9LACO|nr:peptide chain release factor N(5)-glutamine methyltransferase [Levilactobacillus senmaizukei]KRN01768.1 methylase of polypeptide chain release factor [Levilactobacillus senmaizukei DSM 21775 = NBRC 103853]
MANPVTYFSLLHTAQDQLTGARQDPSAAQYLLLEGQNWRYTQLVQHYRDVVPASVLDQFRHQLDRVLAGEPAQYVLGHAPFYGREFQVTNATLIPRQETEELVEWVLTDCSQAPLKLADIGTGSGAIALSLKLERPEWQVTATDISVAAVAVAQQNAKALNAQVQFEVGDLLAPLAGQRFDVIVSNPPYIDRAEQPVMDDAVKRFEPDQALYAADHGLDFYRRFALTLPGFLTAEGCFFAEIGYHQGPAVRAIFTVALPAAKVTVRQDINGQDRMVKVQL